MWCFWPQKWQSYPSGVPRSGMGSTETASANFRLGLGNIVTFIKTTLKKDVISILGQAVIYHTLHSSSLTDFPSDSSCGDMNWMPLFLRGKIKKILNFMIILLLPLLKNTIWFFSKYLRKPAPKRVAFTCNGWGNEI